MRKLVTIREIESVVNHPNADFLDLAQVGGWQVVVKRDEFRAGNKAFYFEIDSLLPAGNPAWDFLIQKSAKEYEPGKLAHRLRTIKLKQEFSQGLLLPLHKFDIEISDDPDFDYSEILGVTKYEPPEPRSGNGPNKLNPRGEYPYWIPKTDQERVENCYKDIEKLGIREWVVEEKLEGSSITVYSDCGKLGITSRNVDFRLDGEFATDNHFVQTALRQKLDVITEFGGRWALRGELIGPQIQGNLYKLKQTEVVIFDVWDGDHQRYLTHEERELFLDILESKGAVFRRVSHHFVDRLPSRDEIIKMADGQSTLYPTAREGLVWKTRHCVKGKFGKDQVVSFKAISREYLAKQKD